MQSLKGLVEDVPRLLNKIWKSQSDLIHLFQTIPSLASNEEDEIIKC